MTPTLRLVSRRIALLVFAALVAFPPAVHAQPRNEEAYLFLLKRFALVKNDSVINGNVGVQNARGKLKVGRGAAILGLGVGDRVFLSNAAVVLQIFANTLKFNPDKTFPGPVTQPVPLPVYVTEPLVVPDPFDPANFPPAFPIACGGLNKIGDKNEAFALAPGSYGAVKVEQGGKLVLGPGVYNFCVLEAVRGDIEITGPVTINVRDKFGLGNMASLLPVAPFTSNDIQINVEGRGTIRISANSRLTGRIFAPNAQIRLGRMAVVRGHFVADKLRSDKGFSAFPPDSAPQCGDGVVNGLETCDPPGVAEPPNGNVCRSDCTFCGDNLLQVGEDCDDGNANNGDTCRNDCTLPPPPLCGNGSLDPGETCDPPGSDPAPAGGNLCRTDCTYCGDGLPNGGEQCDDGNTNDTDACTNTCVLAVQTPCGNEIVEAPETCDPPGSDPPPPGGNLCRLGCTYCGDGVPNGGEECDDGNTVDNDSCRNNCKLTPPQLCGNHELDAGETCDPPGSDPPPAGGNLCRVNCTYCGDAQTQAGEECDDGNTDDQDGCGNDCRLTQPPMCGDGVLDPPDETCDPPGSDPMAPSGELCRGDCTFCGDGVVDPSEQCDDGDDASSDDDSADGDSSGCDGSSDGSSSCGGTSDSVSSDDSSSGDSKSSDDLAPCDGDDDDDSSGCDGSSDGSSSCGGTSDSVSSDASSSDDSGNKRTGGGGDDDSSDCDGSSDGSSSCGGTSDSFSSDDSSSDDSGGGSDDSGSGDDSVDCRDDCTFPPDPVCGDGEVNRRCETCDPPGSQTDGTTLCRVDCTFCGDGVVDPGEECDPGDDDDSDDGSSGCDGSSDDSSSCGGTSDSVSSDASSSDDSGAKMRTGGGGDDDSSGCDADSDDSSSCGGTSDSVSSDDSSSDDSESNDEVCLPDCTLGDRPDDDSSGCDGSSDDSSSCGGVSDSHSSDASSSDDSSSGSDGGSSSSD